MLPLTQRIVKDFLCLQKHGRVLCLRLPAQAPRDLAGHALASALQAATTREGSKRPLQPQPHRRHLPHHPAVLRFRRPLIPQGATREKLVTRAMSKALQGGQPHPQHNPNPPTAINIEIYLSQEALEEEAPPEAEVEDEDRHQQRVTRDRIETHSLLKTVRSSRL